MIKVNKDTVTIIGLLIGITTFNKKLMCDEPSNLAASHNSLGIFLKYCLNKKLQKYYP